MNGEAALPRRGEVWWVRADKRRPSSWCGPIRYASRGCALRFIVRAREVGRSAVAPALSVTIK